MTAATTRELLPASLGLESREFGGRQVQDFVYEAVTTTPAGGAPVIQPFRVAVKPGDSFHEAVVRLVEENRRLRAELEGRRKKG